MTGTTKTQATQTATAGRDAEDVRSDLNVVIEPRESGGIVIEVESRVAPYYGAAIQTQAGQVLKELGVSNARVHIRDQGALPFTIAARIEAAVRRAGLGEGKRALPERVAQPPASAKDRLRRSRLYLPGSEPKFFVNAGLHGPDTIILDLEDSVHAAEKDSARILVRNALRCVSFGAAERMVRINQLPMGLADLDEVIPEAPDLVLLPKVERAEQVVEADRRIREISTRYKLDRPVWLMPILESALGIENAFSIVSASERVAALTIGLEDYTADLGVVKTTQGDESLYARLRLVNAARAAGVQAIDSVYGDVDDLDGLRRWGQRSRALGFEGMGCIHPRQIPVIHEAFAPSQAEIEKAQRIVAAFEDAQRRGLGVVSLGSKMIDAPVVHRALKLVGQAKAMGLLPPEKEH
ncbi:MAG: aldolase/citrate lyase family protein [Acidobacteria bacterium]|nr:aldolase/citrate lyase family protein [Acidobacteriota bacterium]MCL5287388.1 aldolase/citrate lyase family protein [Acidobacteriota bacterium]